MDNLKEMIDEYLKTKKITKYEEEKPKKYKSLGLITVYSHGEVKEIL